MKYLIHARGGDPLLFANILSEELFRFDIRAEINGRESIEELSVGSFSSSAFDVNADVIIVIGNDFNKKLISQSKSVGIRSLFIAIEESEPKSTALFNRVFTSLPTTIPNFTYLGNYTLDLIKKHPFDTKAVEEGLNIGILLPSARINLSHVKCLIDEIGNIRTITNILISNEELTNSVRKIQKSKAEVIYKPTFDILKYANVVVAIGDDNSLKATLMNCPQVAVDRTKWLSYAFFTQTPLILNEILQRRAFKEFALRNHTNIVEEINLILANHEYCASILTEYQEVLERLGGESSARNMAREITTWLEKDL